MNAIKKHRVLPGFGLSLGTSLFYLGLIVLLPLSALIFRSSALGWQGLWEILGSERVLRSYRLT
ncbi:MAG: sulfate ABC transporter permease subunit CysT, partial [Candidatus Marinimicrobia bacterium]|nr:sulfate ABC transporter permease subunit CysT [Candidatus Neomarinimicrobiota bacterium]